MSLIAASQIAELTELVYSCVPAGETMVDNLEELLTHAVEAKARAKLVGSEYAGTFVLPTSDMLSLVKIQLPFMPECVKYVGCNSIKYAGGLFVPCGAKPKPGTIFCNACSKKAADKGAHEFGTLDERKEAFDNEESYAAGGKTEISYGDYLVAKKLSALSVKEALREVGISINIPTRCLATTGAAKKRSGRPSKKAEAAAVEDSDELNAPKPKAPRVKLTDEEKLAKLKADLELKAENAKKRDEDKKIRDAKKAEEAIEKEKNKNEKEKAKAEKAIEKAAAEEKKPKKTKTTEENLQAALAALDINHDDNDDNKKSPQVAAALASDDDDDDDDDDEQKFNLISIKGITYQHNIQNHQVFAETDEKHRFCVGVFNADKKHINYKSFDDAPTKDILEELISFMMKNKSERNNLVVGGQQYKLDVSNGRIADKQGKTVRIFRDGELCPFKDLDRLSDSDDEE